MSVCINDHIVHASDRRQPHFPSQRNKKLIIQTGIKLPRPHTLFCQNHKTCVFYPSRDPQLTVWIGNRDTRVLGNQTVLSDLHFFWHWITFVQWTGARPSVLDYFVQIVYHHYTRDDVSVHDMRVTFLNVSLPFSAWINSNFDFCSVWIITMASICDEVCGCNFSFLFPLPIVSQIIIIRG